MAERRYALINHTHTGSSSVVLELSDLTDVNTSTATARNVLVADGVDWESRALVEADISDLQAYLTTVQLSDLTDVNTSTPTNRNVLVADGIDWESRALVEADISDLQTYLTTVQLTDLTDVNTSTPTNRNVLVADGVDWESRALVEADISDLGSYSTIGHTHVEADITDLQAYLLASSSPSITGTWSFTNPVNVPEINTASGTLTLGAANTVVQIDGGDTLRIANLAETDYADFYHNGTDFNTAFTLTTDWNITGANVVIDQPTTVDQLLITTNLSGTELDVEIGGTGNIGAETNLNFFCDVDNNSTAATFNWYTDAYGVTSGTLLATLTDDGDFSTISSIETPLIKGHVSGGGANNILHLRDTTDATDLVFYYNGTDHYIESELNSTGNRYIRFAQASGTVHLYEANAEKFRTYSQGIRIAGAVAAATPPTTEAMDTHISLFDSAYGNQVAQLGFVVSNTLEMRNLMHGGKVLLRGQDASGANKNILQGDPDDTLTLYYNGTEKLDTTSDGISIKGNTNNDPATGGVQTMQINMANSGGTEIGDIGWLAGTANMTIRNLVHGGVIQIQGQETAGTTRNMFQGDPDGEARLYYNGTLTLATKSTGADVTGDLRVRTGGDLYIYDSGNTDYGQFYHNGTDFFLDGGNTTWFRVNTNATMNGTLNLQGAESRWYSSANTAYVRIGCDSTSTATISTNSAVTDFILTGQDQLVVDTPILIKESAAAVADQAGYGQLWIKNDTPNTLWFTDDAGNDSAVSMGATAETTASVYKTSNTSRSSTTTLADDPDLAGIALTAGRFYKVEAIMNVECAASGVPDLKWRFQFSNAAVGQHIEWQAIDEDGTTTQDTGAMTTTWVTDLVAGQEISLRISGSFISNATTGGTLDFQWAQNTSNANSVIIYTVSYLRVTDMGPA